MQEAFSVTLDWQNGYEFLVDFEQEGVPPLRTDEGPPLGAGSGPTPTRLLAAAVGNCMSASLRYCLGHAKINLLDLKTHVEGTIVRNEQGRLRVGSLTVHLEPMVAPEDRDRVAECIEGFEDFCTVGQSVRQGIDLEVEVTPGSRVVAAQSDAAGG
ncbi:MAG: OsmC family protein [Gemmatimonadota bacterium]